MTTPPTREPDLAHLLRKLTPREAQALAHLAAGHDLAHIATTLGVTPATARNYLHRAMRKLGAPTTAAAVALAHPGGVEPGGNGRAAGGEGGPAQPGDAAPSGRQPKAPHGGAPTGHGQPTAAARQNGAAPGDRTRQRNAVTDRSAQPGTTDSGSRQPKAPTAGPQRSATHSPTPPSGDLPAAAMRHGRQPDGAGTEPPDVAPATAKPRGGRPGNAPLPGEMADEEQADGRRGMSSAALPATAHARGGPSGDTEVRPSRQARDDVATKQSGKRGIDSGAKPSDGVSVATAKPSTRAPSTTADGVSGAVAEPSAGADSAAGGGSGGFEELYEGAYVRVVQQVFLLTGCRHRAVHCVRVAFGEARRGWARVGVLGDPEGWVRGRASELALSPWHRGGPRRAHGWSWPRRRIRVRPADEGQAVLPDHDRLTDRDRALLKALKRLSRPQRRALVLHDGLGLPAEAVAMEVESTLAAAQARVWSARVALAGWVPDLVGPDPAAPEFADGLSGLLHRAAVRGCPQPHRAAVPVLRARHRLSTASRTGAAALLTVAVGGATLATLAGLRPAVLMRPPEPPAPVLCVAAPGAEVEEPGVPVLPGGGPVGVRSLWCSPAPGLEAVVVEPQPQAQAAGRWRQPQVGRGADAPPPAGPAACPAFAVRPCTHGAP